MDWPGHQSTLPGAATRTAHDSLGAVEVPAAALYGTHTARARANFAVPGPLLADCPELVHAMVRVKIAAARANAELGALAPELAAAIEEAGDEVLAGRHTGEFVLPVLQGGGGTSTNMNVNEVLAARAEQLLAGRGTPAPVHPNDHVNRCQSTNDVLPTAIGIAVHQATAQAVEALTELAGALRGKAAEYPALHHLGRTCLQDAVPLPVRDVHLSQAHSVRLATDALRARAEALLAVPLGATAVGTGIGAVPGFAALAVHRLAELTGLPVRAAENPCHGLASLDPLVEAGTALSGCGRALARIATDLRLLASGPHGGIGELVLPSVQSGSSIMPGKVNPVIPELVMQVSFQLAGAVTTAQLAAAAGELEVSAMAPVVTLNLLTGLRSLTAVARIFRTACIDGLRWREDVVAANLAGSLAGAVRSSAVDGYDAASESVLATSPNGVAADCP